MPELQKFRSRASNAIENNYEPHKKTNSADSLLIHESDIAIFTFRLDRTKRSSSRTRTPGLASGTADPELRSSNSNAPRPGLKLACNRTPYAWAAAIGQWVAIITPSSSATVNGTRAGRDGCRLQYEDATSSEVYTRPIGAPLPRPLCGVAASNSEVARSSRTRARPRYLIFHLDARPTG